MLVRSPKENPSIKVPFVPFYLHRVGGHSSLAGKRGGNDPK